MMSNVKTIFDNMGIDIDNKILTDIMIELTLRASYKPKSKANNHVSFLIDNKTKEILSFSFNLYYKAKKFPYSIHSEINTITKYYKKDIKKNIQRVKKILIVLKISKSGTIGNSKPCKSCANYIYSNFNNLNLINVFYSTDQNILEKLNKEDFTCETFKTSSGGRYFC